MKYIGKISQVLKHSHGSCVVVAFDKNLHEGYIWSVYRDVSSFILHQYIFLSFLKHDTKFYDGYITSDDKQK